MSEQQVISERCSECGSTAQERALGVQMAEMVAEAAERAKEAGKRDDPVVILRRLARQYGYELTAVDPPPAPRSTYFDRCPCNPANGGNGMCGCVLGGPSITCSSSTAQKHPYQQDGETP